MREVRKSSIDIRNPVAGTIRKQTPTDGQNPNVAPSYGSGVEATGDGLQEEVSFPSGSQLNEIKMKNNGSYKLKLTQANAAASDFTNGKLNFQQLSNDPVGFKGFVANYDLGALHEHGTLQNTQGERFSTVVAEQRRLEEMKDVGRRNYGG